MTSAKKTQLLATETSTKISEDVFVTELYENAFIIEQKGASCTMEGKRGGEHKIPLAIHAEIIDMREYDNAYDNSDYPFMVHLNITAKEFHKTYKEKALNGLQPNEISEMGIYEECVRYGGGVPLSMVGISGGGEDWSGISSKIAENNRGDEWREFADYDSCKKYIMQVIAKQVPAVFMMIGFTLDKQVNMIGNSGWDIISDQALGTDRFANIEYLRGS